MKASIYALIAGIVFGVGLGVSQMTNPNKVINFLDITGNWDPSLAFVMGGAFAVFLVGYKFIIPGISKPLASQEFQIPKRSDIDRNLIIGSMIFGIGWALSGYCPAPGITSAVTMTDESLYFLVAMAMGVFIYHFMFNRKKYEDG